jgi:hypothetical protein
VLWVVEQDVVGAPGPVIVFEHADRMVDARDPVGTGHARGARACYLLLP